MNKREFEEFTNLIEELQAECLYFKNIVKQFENKINAIHPKSNVLKYIKIMQNEEK